MVNNSTRIFHALQEAKEAGVLEIDLFSNWEKSGAIRVAKYRLNKILENDAVRVVNSIWYLSSEYWEMSKGEFQIFMHRWDVIHMQHKNNLVVLAIVGVFAVLSILSYNVGVPNNFETCLDIFGYDAEFQD